MSPISCFLVNMGIILDKLFGGGAPVVESSLDTASSCQSQCCDTEVISEVSSSNSSERTHASRYAHSRPSFETIPPAIESIPCESGIYVVAPKVCQTSGGEMDMKL